jgi:hypothetical protein
MELVGANFLASLRAAFSSFLSILTKTPGAKGNWEEVEEMEDDADRPLSPNMSWSSVESESGEEEEAENESELERCVVSRLDSSRRPV